MLTCAPRVLPYRGRRLADRLGDLGVRHVENLVEHEDGPFRRFEGFKHGQHRDRDALGKLDILGDVRAGQQRFR
jgi:hypothetical protein